MVGDKCGPLPCEVIYLARKTGDVAYVPLSLNFVNFRAPPETYGDLRSAAIIIPYS